MGIFSLVVQKGVVDHHPGEHLLVVGALEFAVEDERWAVRRRHFPQLVGLPLGSVLQIGRQRLVLPGGNAQHLPGHGREDVSEHLPEYFVVILRHLVVR